MRFEFDPNAHRYPSRRNLVYGRKGMVATGNPLAAQAGLDILRRGGNAVDAAVATATTLAVVEPTSNGIGSDAFAIVCQQGELYGLNASGPAPRSISAQAVRDAGFEQMPEDGVLPINVPGAPAAWAALIARFGELDLETDMAPAIEYASEGFVLQPHVGLQWGESRERLLRLGASDDLFQPWFDTFDLPGGGCPAAGDVLRLPDHARTLEEIAATGARAFYEGDLAERTVRFLRSHGGYLEASDLASFEPEWVEPVSTSFGGFDVFELPPNCQGIAVLMALSILAHLECTDATAPGNVHLAIEALKLALTDAKETVTDPRFMKEDVGYLLSDEYAAGRAALVGGRARMPRSPIRPDTGGTVYLCTADAGGNMVSFIQSGYRDFGSGVVIPGTGISMNDRGANFSLDENDDNVLAGGKRSYHTIIPGFLMRDGNPVGPFGIMGGFIQAQAHEQVLLNLILDGDNPQDALDKPRCWWQRGNEVWVEEGFPDKTARYLEDAGHEVVRRGSSEGFGRGEIIWRDDGGVLVGATEKRTDGMVATW